MNAVTDIAKIIATLPQRSAEELEKWRWRNDTLPRLASSRLPERFRVKLKTWGNPKQEAAHKTVFRLLQGKGAIVALIGARGTGKTTIAAQIIIARAENEQLEPWNRQPSYRKLTDLITRFKPLYADFGTIDTEDLTRGRDVWVDQRLVVIDEIGECEEQKLKNRVLTDLLDRRYSAKRDTIIISNETPEEFTANHSDSILSRIREHGRVIACNWPSWRTA